MKKYIYILLVSGLIWSCGGEGGEPSPTPPSPEPPVVNNPPTTPTLVDPTNNLLCIDNTVSFSWNASTDPEGNSVKYQLQIATDTNFSQIEHDLKNISGTSKSVSLNQGIAYYWRVKAEDSKGKESGFSSNFNFYTEGEGIVNHLPFSPELVSPELNEIIKESTATLSWAASDADVDDTLTFDVYFGTVNPLTSAELVSENQTESTLNVTVNSSNTYYWKIVVKDNIGGQTIGQTWIFKTD